MARPRPPYGLFRALRFARARGQLRRHPALRRTATAAQRRYAPGRQTFCCADQCNPSVGLQGSWAEPCLSRSLIPEKLDGLATGTLPELKLVKFSSVSIRVATGDPDRSLLFVHYRRKKYDPFFVSAPSRFASSRYPSGSTAPPVNTASFGKTRAAVLSLPSRRKITRVPCALSCSATDTASRWLSSKQSPI